MRFYTAHVKPGRPPVLVRESWSWGAFLFGPLWLLVHRAWIPAVIAAAAGTALLLLVPGRWTGLVLLAFALVLGLLGRDMVRWSLGRRGYALDHVLAARDEEAALGRLLTARTDLARSCAGPLP